MKSNSSNRPPVFEALGNGAYYYNYNIVENQIADENGEVKTSFDYDQVKLWGTPTKKEVIKAVIAERWDITKEIDIANDNKRFELGLSEDETFRDKYVEYINTVSLIKEMVSSDFERVESNSI